MKVKSNVVRVSVGICAAVFGIANCLPVLAADPGGQFGFVKATFTGSACDTTSDVFANAKSWVWAPEEMYANSLSEYTTVAWGAYMYMEAGVRYDFKGCYDDYAIVKIGSTWVPSKGSECQERTGSYTPLATDWYKIDLRVANNGGVGGCYETSKYGILWKRSTETTWRKFAAGDLFKTGEISVDLEKPGKPFVEIVSAQMRETDPTVMDVKYRVWSAGDTVNVRALVFQDGVRSFANVVRPAKFLEGSQIGDGVLANTVNSFAWQVSADWDVDLAKVAVEVLAQDVGAGLVPLDLVTIPAHGDYAAVTCSTNVVTDAEFLDAIYWLYADGDKDLALKDGWLRDSQDRILVKGNALQGDGFAAEFVYNRMGFSAMGSNCQWPHAVVAAVERIRRASMPYSGNHRYTVKGLTAPAAQTMGSGLYMVVDLNGNDFHFPVTYMDSAPAKWGDEYKTNKIVLRRIDGSTHEVGTRQPNAWGLYDVHGNVFEWCLNRWLSGYSSRVLRGGSYYSDASYCASGYRSLNGPSDVWDYSGFRLACRPGSN